MSNMTDSNELELAQTMLENKIYEMAEQYGLSSDDVEPITDGVYDAGKYLSSNRRVMWIMKEPYDEIVDGKPMGGGWSLPRDCFAKGDAWSNPSWQPIIYSMYGLKNGIMWNDMNWIRDDRSMADMLQGIAYINVSKMPNRSVSDDSYIGECYEIWKNLLFEQIEAYNPDVMIFAKTFSHFRNDLGKELRKLGGISYNGVLAGDAYEWKGRLLLSVMHPNNRSITREIYVNSIIETICKFFKNK